MTLYAHAQLYRFYLDSIPDITCVTSRTRPGSPPLRVKQRKGGSGLGVRLTIIGWYVPEVYMLIQKNLQRWGSILCMLEKWIGDFRLISGGQVGIIPYSIKFHWTKILPKAHILYWNKTFAEFNFANRQLPSSGWSTISRGVVAARGSRSQ